VIAGLATAQHGVVARWQLAVRGVTNTMIQRRVASGHLYRMHPAVYAVGHQRLSLTGLRHAAVLAGGPRAALSHRTAAAVWDLRPDNRLTIDVTAPTHKQSSRRIAFHRATLAPEDIDEIDGLRVISLSRTLLDLAAHVRAADVHRALERADRLNLLDARALDALCARNRGHHGLKNLREALKRYDPRHHRTRSELEREALAAIDARGLPRPLINEPIIGGEADLYWPEHKIAVELDGFDTHKTREAFERDRQRDRARLLAGIASMRLTSRQLGPGLDDLSALLSARETRLGPARGRSG
jgi:hypothetical protein